MFLKRVNCYLEIRITSMKDTAEHLVQTNNDKKVTRGIDKKHVR